MKGIHKNNKVATGNVEMRKIAFQQAKSKKSSLAKAAEDSLKFQKMVEDSNKKVVPRKEDGTRGKKGGIFSGPEKPLGNIPMDEDEEENSGASPGRLDIRI